MSNYFWITLVFTITILLMLYIRNLRNIEKENLRLQKNLNQANQFFDEVNKQVDNIRRYRHDLKKHIRIVEEFLNKGKYYEDYEEYQELVRLMSGMQQDEERSSRKRFCDHEVLNAICEIKKKECDQENAGFEVEIDYQNLRWVDDFHLTGIIMNLLDNALEAQQRLDQDEIKLITLTIRQSPATKQDSEKDDGQAPLTISVGNTIHKGEKIDFKTRKDDKKNHGMGLDIAREYSKIYGGGLTYQYDEAKHFLVITATLKNQES